MSKFRAITVANLRECSLWTSCLEVILSKVIPLLLRWWESLYLRVLEQEPNHRVLRSSPSFKGLSHSIIISTKTRIICFRKLIKVSQAKKRSLTSHQRVVTKFKSRFRYHQLRNPQLTKARVCIQRSSQTISLSWTKLKVLIQSTHRVGKKLEVNSLFKVRVKFLKARKWYL